MATTTLHIRPADDGRVMTLQEFFAAEEEEGYRYELARGVLEVSDIPDDAHGMIVWHLFQALWCYREAHPGVIDWYGSAGDFRFWIASLISARSPDVAIVLKGAPKDLRGRRIPALAVEIVTEGSEVRDYVIKREEYLAYGLFEYWIVDPEARKVTALLRDGSAWVERVAEGDQVIPSLVLPGLATKVADLWAVDDEDEDENDDDAPAE
jgi:Uma2 family endonuclease